MTTKRHRNDGLRKLCECPRKRWSDCPHSWYFNYKWRGRHYRFSLDKELGRRIDSKTAADKEAEDLRVAIREGKFRAELPARETATLAQLSDRYHMRHVQVERKDTADRVLSQLGVILRTEVDRLDGSRRAFGDWPLVDITTDTIEQFRDVRTLQGPVAAKRDLELLRHMFKWAVLKKIIEATPFRVGTEVAITMKKAPPRRRRLQPGEATRLLAVATPHLRAVIEAAIETGCRKGELLKLQWSDVTLGAKSEIFLPASKTKTKTDRKIPVSSRLKAILEMRRNGPDGEPHKATAFVFGNEVGEAVADIKRAWQTAVLKAHDHTPTYVLTGKVIGRHKVRRLSQESHAQYAAIGLHFHDLRREAGSRWLDAGVPLHRIQKWLGHTKVSQTSTYLMAESADDDQAMRLFEERWNALQKLATKPRTPRRKRTRLATTPDNNSQFATVKHH